MERLKSAKERLMCAVESQLGHLDTVNAEELGEVVDMIKDFEEAMYYCAKVKELEEKGKMLKKENEMYEKYENMPPEIQMEYADRMKRHFVEDPEYMRDMDKPYGRMYYPMARNAKGGRDGRYGYHEIYNPNEYGDWDMNQYPHEMLRDGREGKSPLSRKHFMESKAHKKDTASQNKELEKYLNELADDISEMIGDATPEQKIMMSQKLATLSNKIK